VTGSTSDRAVADGGRSLAVALAVGGVAVAALTALVFLMRAGGDPGDAASWPITWELRSSDNGTLFQFWSDVVAGRPLDWSFSPQVYVFPELPMSGLAYLISFGNLYVYYLVVAVLNQIAFFLLLAALARTLWPGTSSSAVVLRAAAGSAPLVLLPLVGTTWLFSFHLAPTYYVGMYLALLAAPLLLLVRTRVSRLLLAAALALTIASNPLTVVFAAPGLLAVLVARLARSGRRGLGRPALLIAVIGVAAVLARLAFTPLQGTGLLTYVDLAVFRARVDALWPYWSFQMIDPAARMLLPLGAILAVGCLVVALAAGWMLARKQEVEDDSRAFAALFLGLIPIGGLVATVAALITHYYYFWPLLVLPFVLALFAIPRPALEPVVVAGGAAFIAVGLLSGGVFHLADADRYFGYRGAETRCLDRVVPGQVGFATFSDARRVALPSATGIRLIPLTMSLEANLWLTNRSYAREAGTFFYLDDRGDELALDRAAILAGFGTPSDQVACDDGRELWIYDDPVTIAP
jgi:hypothetical protein